MRLILGVTAETIQLLNIGWNCGESNNLVAFDHSIADEVVKLTVTLPACANVVVPSIGSFANGHLYRNATISYELPNSHITPNWSDDVGRRMTVYVRPNGPARFIIEHGGPSGIAWFDTP
jgi:hypothetical protein